MNVAAAGQFHEEREIRAIPEADRIREIALHYLEPLMTFTVKQVPNSYCLLSPISEPKKFTLLLQKKRGPFRSVKRVTLLIRKGKISADIPKKGRVPVTTVEELLASHFHLRRPILLKQSWVRMKPEIKLLYKTILPKFYRSGKEWSKASRRKYPALERSLWLSREGEVLRQSHGKKKRKQDFIGEGKNKIIWKLQPHPKFPSQTPYVRAALEVSEQSHPLLRQNRFHVEKLRASAGNCKQLVLPVFVLYYSPKKQRTVSGQIMPEMRGGDLQSLGKNSLSLLGKLRVAEAIALGLKTVHASGFSHCDLKPENVVLGTDDPDNPEAALIDWDFLTPLSNKGPCPMGSPLFSDPAVLAQKATGAEAARKNDLFGMGGTLYELFANSSRGFRPESRFLVALLNPLRQSIDMPALHSVPEPIQEWIKACCLGPLDERNPDLSQFLKTVRRLIQEEIADKN